MTTVAIALCFTTVALAVAVAAILLLLGRQSQLRATVRATALIAVDEERRRIERDLHDGAQQRLTALRIQLELTAQMLSDDPQAAAEKLRALGQDMDTTIDSVRALARGIYPSVLTTNGLPTALRAAALDVGMPVTVLPGGAGRYPPEVESAVYFCCAEALQNAARHSGAAAVAIALDPGADGALSFEVRDDGTGFDLDAAEQGAGIRNMRERIAAVGGEVTITSAPGQGTIVTGTTGLPAASPSRA